MIFEIFDIDIKPDPQSFRVFIPVVGCLIGYIIFWFTQKSDRIKQKFLNKHGTDQGYAKFIMFTRYLGGFSMGVLPVVTFLVAFPDTSLSQLGLGVYKETLLATVIWAVLLSVIMIPLVSFNARKPMNLINHPQIRAKEWNKRMVKGNLVSWVVYLLGYEFLFRGVLLFPLVEEIGLWPAIAVNIGMYSATHIPHGLKITIGTIPLSIVLCLLSVQTGTIWIAFFVHTTIALTNSLTALKYNPEMKIVKK